MQKLKNNEPRPKFTGSYKKKRVPQGTLLAPLLFLLFIDGIKTNIDSQCAFLQTIVSYTELFPPASEFPAASNFFFICNIPHMKI